MTTRLAIAVAEREEDFLAAATGQAATRNTEPTAAELRRRWNRKRIVGAKYLADRRKGRD